MSAPSPATTPSSRSGPGRPASRRDLAGAVERPACCSPACSWSLLTWLGTREVIGDRLTIGQLISFFGYALFMICPIQTFFEFAQKRVRASCRRRKAIAIFEPAAVARRRRAPLRLPEHGVLHDELTGFVARAGRADDRGQRRARDDSAALADRLGRYLPADTEPVSQDVEEGLSGRAARRCPVRARPSAPSWPSATRALAGQRWGVSLGGVDLADAPIADVRTGSWSATPGARCSPAPCRTPIDPHGRLTAGAGRGGAAAPPTPRTCTTRCPAAGRASSTSGPRAVRRSAAAGGAGPRAGRAPDPDPGRADLGRRRPHRGADRRAGGRLRPAEDDDRHHRLAAVAALRRPGGVPGPASGSSPTAPTRTCCAQTRPTARSWPGPMDETRWRR